jgi:hypothetical protein
VNTFNAEILAIAKSTCSSVAYWAKDLERTCGGELDVNADGGWPPELVPEGHCDIVELPDEAGESAGLAAAASGPNKKMRTQALALSVLLTAAHHFGMSEDELRNIHPALQELHIHSSQALHELHTSI